MLVHTISIVFLISARVKTITVCIVRLLVRVTRVRVDGLFHRAAISTVASTAMRTIIAVLLIVHVGLRRAMRSLFNEILRKG